MSEQNIEKKRNPDIVEKYDGKTVRITKDGRSKIYVISVEYVEGIEVEVMLRSISTDTLVSSKASEEDFEKLGNISKEAFRVAIGIAEDIESNLEVDFIGEDLV